MKKAGILFLFVCAFFTVKASHLLGSDISYRLINQGHGGKFYEIIYTEYIAPEGSNSFPRPLSIPIQLNSSCQAINTTLDYDGIDLPEKDVTPFCFPTVYNTPSGTISAVQWAFNQLISRSYIRVIYLPHCIDGEWEITAINGNYSDEITNMDVLYPMAYPMFTSALLITNYNNSSVIHEELPVIYSGINEAVKYNGISIDAEGDELEFIYSEPLDGGLSGTNYALTNLSDWPMSNLTVDPSTGDINYLATAAQNSIFSVRVNEYRTINGVRTLIGSTFRNMNIQVKAVYRYINKYITADFDHEIGVCNRVVQFTDQSTDQPFITNWHWDFGCGHTLNSNGNPGNMAVSATDGQSTDNCANTYTHTTGTYQNPIHDYSHVTLGCLTDEPIYPATRVTLLINNACGPISAASADDLRIFGDPGTISIIGGTDEYCVGDEITLQAQASASSNFDIFNWDVSAIGSILSGQGTPTVTVVITENQGGQISVAAANGCGVPANLFVRTRDCCKVTGLFGLEISNGAAQYTFAKTDKNNYGATILNAACGTAATQVTNAPAQGSSSADYFGNYYYTEGRKLKVLDNNKCLIKQYMLPYNVTEPEVDDNNNTIWMIGNGSLIQYTLPAGVQNGIIQRTIGLQGYTPIAGSSTIDLEPGGGTYYFIAANQALSPANGELGTLVMIDLASGNLNTKKITELNGANAPSGTIMTSSPQIVELEYAANNKLIATVNHLVFEWRETFGEPGNGGNTNLDNPGSLHHILDLDIVKPDPNNGYAGMEKIYYFQWDVMEIDLQSGKARMLGDQPVLFDNTSSSTYDPVEQRYYLTSGNGSVLYTADRLNNGVITQQNSIVQGTKSGRFFFEIEYFNCSNAIQYKSLTATDEQEGVHSNLYPNPCVDGTFTVSVDEQHIPDHIRIMDVFGRLIYVDENPAAKTNFNLSGQPVGVYFVHLSWGGNTEIQKLIYKQ